MRMREALGALCVSLVNCFCVLWVLQKSPRTSPKIHMDIQVSYSDHNGCDSVFTVSTFLSMMYIFWLSWSGALCVVRCLLHLVCPLSVRVPVAYCLNFVFSSMLIPMRIWAFTVSAFPSWICFFCYLSLFASELHTESGAGLQLSHITFGAFSHQKYT